MSERIRTHWDGCWRSRDHHECAIARVERLEAEVARLRDELARIEAGYRHDYQDNFESESEELDYLRKLRGYSDLAIKMELANMEEERNNLRAEIARLRHRCTPHCGDPTKKQILSEIRWHVSENRIVAPALRALLRIWENER